ncbi:SusC/RagA family TonB-linked outer membrane protein [Sinomicrobium soli]|uniref:SusC/RagA family TonB-linked outer membrane protein n=1 Tax=Sinomicrobium sp. N-1-3-6 TaxID=2219864 RepID=UPI000DCF06FF|nr:TonB-dependent receptor [Sinomicrobium sp. N-1-3-6]RAV30185.1 SusC/RagA family TonB-linked outer membrane protein [Sinomicrobium sp. N-1-3-6]
MKHRFCFSGRQRKYGAVLILWLGMLIFSARSYAFQEITVTGTVTATSDGMPLSGASIVVKDAAGQGTVTDFDGNFEIVVNDPNSILVFSYIGFETREVPVAGQTTLNVSLSEDTQQLGEVVVVGYGARKRTTLTGSVSEVKGESITKSPQPNVSNAFSGRMSGVIASNRSGEPGYDDSSISIRGLATTGNNDVLVVVDGVPGQVGGLNRLNPQEIESVTVLKDASAAIYGSRAANGVILVTTKKGRKGSKLTVNYTFDQGFSSPTRLPDMADAATYARIRNEIAYYNDTSKGMNQIYTEDDIAAFGDGSDPLNYPDTDWADAALRKTALQSQHNLNVQGGSENTNYFFSIGKLSQEGLYENGATHYNQYNVRTNIDTNISERLKVGVSLSGRKEDRKYPVASAGNIFRSIYRAYPTVAAYFPNGLPTTGIENSNPVIEATSMGGTTENPTYVFNGILRASYDIPWVEGLSVDGFFSTDVSQGHSRTFAKPYVLYSYNRTDDLFSPITVGGGANQRPSLSEEQINQSMTVSNIKLNFKRSFGLHNLDAFIGFEQSKNKSHTFGASRINFASSETPELSQGGSASTDYDNWGESYTFTRQSYLSRIAYDYDEKYLLELQMRVDGSSNFPKGERFGFFPSVSAGYVITREDWFREKVPFMNELKFRGSWGQLGNDNVGQFQFFDNYLFNNRYVTGGEVTTGVDLSKLANPFITWEVATKTDVGINARWLDNFTTELIYFRQNRSDILTSRNASIPGTTGIVNPYDDGTEEYNPLVPDENIGKVNSYGFEASLGYRSSGNEFNWGVTGNFTYAKNKIIFNDEAPGTLAYQRETGHPMNTYLLYNAIGIFRSEDELAAYPHVPGARVGDLIYEDYNEDGRITADDMVRTKYGNIPQMTFGLVMDADYKNFDLSVVFSGQAQVSQYVLPESGTVGNYYSSWADNRYSPSNPGGSYPRVSERASSAVSGGLYRNNFWLNDASFIRLKNVQLGYTVPKSIFEKYGIEHLRVYASAFNLFTITSVKDYDPEGNNESGQFYPQQRIINLGFNVQF